MNYKGDMTREEVKAAIQQFIHDDVKESIMELLSDLDDLTIKRLFDNIADQNAKGVEARYVEMIHELGSRQVSWRWEAESGESDQATLII